MYSRNSINRLKLIALWIWAGKFHLLSIASFAVAVLYLTNLLQFHPGIVALFMTLIGLLIILTQQIIDTTKFGSHNPNTFKGWLKSFPKGKPDSLSSLDGKITVISSKAHATASIPVDAAIEEKVDFLLREFIALDSAIAKIDERIDEVNSSLKKTSKKFEKSVNTLTTTLNSLIASHVVGSYDVTLFAIYITICGTIIQFFCSSPSASSLP